MTCDDAKEISPQIFALHVLTEIKAMSAASVMAMAPFF